MEEDSEKGVNKGERLEVADEQKCLIWLNVRTAEG